jgi:hypothetical protein
MDHRDFAALKSKWWKSIDTGRMKATLVLPCDDECECGGGLCEEEIEVPIKFEVCPTCEGKGKHVNPSIDAHGITADEWDSDWSYEDRENYMSGFYDVSCYECGGDRVVPEINEDFVDKKILERYNDRVQFLAEEARERAREIKYGY